LAQHYGLTGLAIGLFVLVMAMEWQSSAQRSPSIKLVLAGALGVLAMGVLVNGVAQALNERGHIGMVIGLMFAAPVARLAKLDGLRTLAAGTGLSLLFILAYTVARESAEWMREDRMKALWIHVAVVAVLGLLAVLLGRTSNGQVDTAGPEPQTI
jgi:hypothetical protein